MTQPIPSETIEYERYVDGLRLQIQTMQRLAAAREKQFAAARKEPDSLRRSNAAMLTALKDIILWAERHGLTKADLITGGQAECPVITNARAAIALAQGGAP